MRSILFLFVLLSATYNFAQFPMGARGGGAGGNQNTNIGRFYGKIVDSKTNKGVEAVTVQLLGNKFDSTTKRMKEAILKTVLTDNKGDFSLEGLPIFGNFKLKLSAVGFKSLDQQITFGIKFPQGGAQPNFQEMMAKADKDLGNIKMEADANDLGNVTVTSTAKQMFEMGVDRKIFNVDKNIAAAGQTATEVMRNIPTINVDIDGNVTLRNATPELFVDGRPTTLTLDQIPADIIDRVELITNPSAKFDASGGGAGILNIVLKKNKKVGYNGGLRSGIDSRGMLNIGGDINLRQNKFNFFGSGIYNQRKSLSWSERDRKILGSIPGQVYQDISGVNTGYFAFIRGGFDYFIDNRNTISFSANYNRGQFDNDEDQRIDSTIRGVFANYSDVKNVTNANFRNFGSTVSFKHNFAKTGHEWTADVNFNSSRNENQGSFDTRTFFPDNTPKLARVLGQDSRGTNEFLTIQTDYENPLTDNTKLELGARAALRRFTNQNIQSILDPNTFLPIGIISSASANFKFDDAVYAAYGVYSIKTKRINYQFGLRAESSNYTGTLVDSNRTFNVQFPFSLFPSAFVTYRLTDKQDLQLNVTRRIRRPSFFNLIPFPDFTDPLNPRIGNPGLNPEFTQSFEVSYNNSYKKGANFLVTGFFKHSTNLITAFQYLDEAPIKGLSLNDSVVYTTFRNANSSLIYGVELTNRMPVTKWWDLTLNLNIFNAQINGGNIQQDLNNQRVSWFAKMNSSFKLKKGYTIQLNADYQAKTVLPQGGGGGGFGGGRGGGGGGGFGGFGGGVIGSAQGFILPRYGIDLSVRKDFTWKGGNSGSLTLSMNDIFRTVLQQQTAISPFLDETFQRRRDPQVLRLNFSWRFGKFDPNLFKRKSTKNEGGGMDMEGGMRP